MARGKGPGMWERLVALALLSCAPAAHAEPLALDTVVVTATRSEKSLRDVPVRTEVIAAEALDRQHARDLKEALEYVGGIVVVPIHGKTGYEARIQGLDGNRVLILVDGERVSPSTGSTVDLTQLGIEDVRQIEVIKGAASALHGSNAMGGVINIITREARSGLHGRVSAEAGSYGDKNPDDSGSRVPASRGSARLSWRSARWRHELSADIRNSEGFLIEDHAGVIRGEDGYKANFSARTTWSSDASGSLWSMGYSGYREDYAVAGAIPVPGQAPLDRTEAVERDHLRTRAQWRLDARHGLALSAFGERYRGISHTEVERDIDISLNGATLQHDFVTAGGNVLTSGLEWQRESLDQLRNGVAELGEEGTRRSVEGFFQYDWLVSDRWEVLPGLRYIDDDRFGGHASPKIAVMFANDTHRARHRVRLSYGNGFRVPDLKERYFVFDHSHLGYIVFGNPDLEPETSHSVQLGYEIGDDDGWQLDANLFHNRIRDLIHTRLAGSSGGVARYEYGNIERAMTRGVEVNGSWRVSERATLRSSYTWLDTRNRTTGHELIKSPEHQVKTGLVLTMFAGRGELLLQYLYQSEAWYDEANTQRSPEWRRYDVKYSHELTKHLSLYGGVENVFDEHREPRLLPGDQRPIPGRFLYAGFRFGF